MRDGVNNAEVESKCQSLAVQSDHYKNSSIYQLRTIRLAREIQSIRSFPKDVQATKYKFRWKLIQYSIMP